MDRETLLKGVRDDGTVDGHRVETHYMPCLGALENAAGFVSILIDGPGYNIETRVLDETLRKCGYVRASVT